MCLVKDVAGRSEKQPHNSLYKGHLQNHSYIGAQICDPSDVSWCLLAIATRNIRVLSYCGKETNPLLGTRKMSFRISVWP